MSQLNLPLLSGYTVAILIFMSSMRLFWGTLKFGIPIMHFISFSNIIVYVLDVIYGLTYFIIASCLTLLFRGYISKCVFWIKNTPTWGNIFLVALIIFFFYLIYQVARLYWYLPITFKSSWWLKVLIFIAVGIFGTIVHFYGVNINVNLLLLTMIFVFSWLFMKVVVKYEEQIVMARFKHQTIISFKGADGKKIITSETQWFITNTMEYAFIFDKNDNSYTQIPMSDISSIKTVGDPWIENKKPSITTLKDDMQKSHPK